MNTDIIRAYAGSKRRLFLLDYDGTLAEIAQFPWQATPTTEITDTLTRLAADPNNTVVLISGRNHQDLETWFGALPLAFAAEHGMLVKLPGQDWTVAKDLDTAWREPVQQLMHSYVETLDGSFIEEKSHGLVWHYRAVPDQEAATKASQQLINRLETLALRYQLRIMPGSKIVEVQPIGVNKGIGASNWLVGNAWDFILIAGDDSTDEDMFKVAPATAFTIKVGTGETTARSQVIGPKDILRLLASLK